MRSMSKVSTQNTYLGSNLRGFGVELGVGSGSGSTNLLRLVICDEVEERPVVHVVERVMEHA